MTKWEILSKCGRIEGQCGMREVFSKGGRLPQNAGGLVGLYLPVIFLILFHISVKEVFQLILEMKSIQDWRFACLTW